MAAMTLAELIEALNELSWSEQMEFEMSERDPDVARAERKVIQQRIRALAGRLTPQVLDRLEMQEGYLTWVLRLSLHVPGDSPAQRGRRYLNHEDGQVRYWAARAVKR